MRAGSPKVPRPRAEFGGRRLRGSTGSAPRIRPLGRWTRTRLWERLVGGADTPRIGLTRSRGHGLTRDSSPESSGHRQRHRRYR
eukprot:15215348-Alexandrium_andersonii.AAC.1